MPNGAPQAACACLNAGEFGSIPLPDWNWIPPAWEPWNVGSGKFGRPCARMHRENASIWLRLAADSVRG